MIPAMNAGAVLATGGRAFQNCVWRREARRESPCRPCVEPHDPCVSMTAAGFGSWPSHRSSRRRNRARPVAGPTLCGPEGQSSWRQCAAPSMGRLVMQVKQSHRPAVISGYMRSSGPVGGCIGVYDDTNNGSKSLNRLCLRPCGVHTNAKFTGAPCVLRGNCLSIALCHNATRMLLKSISVRTSRDILEIQPCIPYSRKRCSPRHYY